MSCIPFLYGVGAGVAMVRGYWPPPTGLIVACPPPQPQRPPQQQQQNTPPPHTHYYMEQYDLLIPPMLAFNMNVYGMVDYPTGDRKYTEILPGSADLMLGWRSFPMYDACPQVIATATNQHIHTDLKSLKNLFSTCRSHVVFPWRDISIISHAHTVDEEGNIIMLDIALYVFQFVFFSRSWVVAVYEINIPHHPAISISPESLRQKLNNRRERLYLFHDSEIDGSGVVFTNVGGYDASVYPSHAVLYRNHQIAYTLQPTSDIAYFMLTVRTQ